MDGNPLDFWAAKALLDWQVEMGADEAVGDVPLNRYDLPAEAPKPRPAAAQPAAPEAEAAPVAAAAADPVAIARRMAAAASTVDALAEAMAAFDYLELKKGARNFVFADGVRGARVMIVGEAPGQEEDREGRPFVGRAGQLLDRMFAAIGLSRTSPDTGKALYITNVLPWRPPGNRTPEAGEIAMMLPFLQRHIELAAPDILVLMGNTPCQAVLGRQGILKLRGEWTQACGRPVLPMTHPAYLLRNPAAKREAWADLLTIAERLEGA